MKSSSNTYFLLEDPTVCFVQRSQQYWNNRGYLQLKDFTVCCVQMPQYYWNNRGGCLWLYDIPVCCAQKPQYYSNNRGYLWINDSAVYYVQRQQHFWNNRKIIYGLITSRFIMLRRHSIIEIKERLFATEELQNVLCLEATVLLKFRKVICSWMTP